MVSNNECSVVQRAEKEKISVFKSNLVDGKEIHVTTSDKTLCTNPEQHIQDHEWNYLHLDALCPFHMAPITIDYMG